VRAIKKSEGVLAKLKQEMEFRDYIDPLAEVIRKYPRSGGNIQDQAGKDRRVFTY